MRATGFPWPQVATSIFGVATWVRHFGVATQFLVSRHGLFVWCHDQSLWVTTGSGWCRDKAEPCHDRVGCLGVVTRFLMSRQALALGCCDTAHDVATSQAGWAVSQPGKRPARNDRAPACVTAQRQRVACTRDLGIVCVHYAHDPGCFNPPCCALFGSLFMNTILKKVQN